MVGAAWRGGVGNPSAAGRGGTWAAPAVVGAFVLWGVLVLPPAIRFADSAWGWLAVAALGIGPALLLPRLPSIASTATRSPAVADAGRLEGEVLAALAAHGPSTPAEVALRTSLTIDEAGALLEALASLGIVVATDGAGSRAYALREHSAAGAAAPVGDGGDAPAPGWPHRAASASPMVDPLSGREMDVLALLATGQPNREIAGALYVSIGTVKTHTNNIYRKLGARNRTEAIARARDLSLV